MNQAIIFNKSFKERLEEYQQILCLRDKLSAENVMQEWSYYLELSLDSSGWQALWKIPRVKCESLHINFPLIALVYVAKINFTELKALIKVLSFDDEDVDIPEKHWVDLWELWPTKIQDNSIGINLEKTANVMDMVRFFYIHIWRPWDRELDSNIDWYEKYLVPRLRLYFDINTGLIPMRTAERISALIIESKRLRSRRDFLEEQSDNDQIEVKVLDCSTLVTNNDIADELLDIYVRLTEIKNEMELLEDAVCRIVISRRLEQVPLEKRYWIICLNDSIDNYTKLLQKTLKFYPKNHKFSFALDLMEALDTVLHANDTFVLKPGQHVIKNLEALVANQHIQGLGEAEDTILLSQTYEIMLKCIGQVAVLENITINAQKTYCALKIKRGKVTLRNCVIRGDGLATSRGLKVAGGTEVELSNCIITGFSVGILVEQNATVKLKDCKMYDTSVGIDILDDANCNVSLDNSTISDSRKCGIVIETERNDVEQQSLDFAACTIFPNVRLNKVSGENNLKCDIQVKKPSLEAIEDLFIKPETDPSFIIEDDTIMDDPSNNSMSFIVR